MDEPRLPAVRSGVTIGIEEEYHVVDPVTGHPVAAPPPSGSVRGELQASQIEVSTPVCRTLNDIRRELLAARQAASAAAATAGAVIMAAGTHPFASWTELHRSVSPRYDMLAERFGALTDRQNICGMHVHVGVPDLATALQIMNRARPYLPVLAALSSSSPFHDGVDTRYASFRTVWWTTWPTAGLPPRFASPEAYQRAVDDFVAAGLIDDPSTLYWDVRPSVRYSTVEFRGADVCTDIGDAVLIAALTRSLVRTIDQRMASGAPAADVSDSALAAARWRAARYGVGGCLYDCLSGALRPAAAVVADMFGELEPDLQAHGEAAEVAVLMERVLSRGTSADVQRHHVRAGRDLVEVVRTLATMTMRRTPEEDIRDTRTVTGA